MDVIYFDRETGQTLDECPHCRNLEKELRFKRLQLGQAYKKLDQQQDADEHSDEAQQVFDLWIEVTGRTRRTTFNRERKTPVLARLKDYGVKDVMDAVRGAGIDPYVRDGKRYDDLELICRNGKKLEIFRDRWLAHKEKERKERQGQRPLDTLLTAMRAHEYEVWPTKEPNDYVAICPNCGGSAHIIEHAHRYHIDDTQVTFACKAEQPCAPWDMLQAIDLEPGDLSA